MSENAIAVSEFTRTQEVWIWRERERAEQKRTRDITTFKGSLELHVASCYYWSHDNNNKLRS